MLRYACSDKQEVDPEGPLSLRKKLVRTLEKGKIYAHGNLHSFMEFVTNNRATTGLQADATEKQVRCKRHGLIEFRSLI